MIKICLFNLRQNLNKFKSNSLIKRMSIRADSRCNVRSVESDDDIVISFKYSYDSQNQRFFNFKRNKNEELKQTFARISLNINNCFSKKIKRKNKNKEIKDITLEPIVVQLLVDGKNVSQELKNIDVWKEGSILIIGQNEYEVKVNSPTVRSIKLPKSIMSGFYVYPILLLEFCSFDECLYIWYKQRLPKEKSKKLKKVDNSSECDGNESEKSETEENEEVVGFGGWIKVWEGFHYCPQTDDIGRKLKVVCIPNNGFEMETISENSVESSPPSCPFEERLKHCSQESPIGSFRIVSYNILADVYADQEFTRTELFPYCPPNALKIDYRKQLLIKEIIGYNADIYCLQEVDKVVFENDLKPIISFPNSNKVQYNSVFSEKGQVGEGLAIFFKSSKFELLNDQTVNLSEELQRNPIYEELLTYVSANQKLLERLLARKSVFQCLLLKSLDSKENAILLGNTHLYFHPDADHIRLIQSYMYVKFMEHYIKLLEITRPDLKVSPILCGDFNSCPEFGVYQLMTTGFVQQEIADFKSNSDETIEGFEMNHSLSLESACGTPLYTNFTKGFNGCLDYIFHDTNNLIVSEVVPFPSHEQVIENTALPSIVFPSDHLALVSTLSWIK